MSDDQPRPPVAVTHLGGDTGNPVLVVGPSLGTFVDRLWGEVARVLGEDFHVLGWDLPGHGRSAATTTPFDLAALAASVLGAVEEAGGAGPYLYAGDSVGGAVGLQLALDHPDRVGALAVLCSAARFGTPEPWAERAALVRREGMAPMVESSPGRWFGTLVREQRPDAAAGLSLIHI